MQFCEMYVLAIVIVIVIAVIDSNSKCKHISFAKGLNRRFCWFLLENRCSCVIETITDWKNQLTIICILHHLKLSIRLKIRLYEVLLEWTNHLNTLVQCFTPMKVWTKRIYTQKKTNQNNLIEIHDILQDQSNDIVQS